MNFQGFRKLVFAAFVFSLAIADTRAAPVNTAENGILERALLRFHSSPAIPRVGERISIFAKLESGFQNQEPVIEGFIGDVPVRFEKSGEELYSASLNAYSEVKPEVVLRADIYLQDAKKALRLRQAINGIKLKIVETKGIQLPSYNSDEFLEKVSLRVLAELPILILNVDLSRLCFSM